MKTILCTFSATISMVLLTVTLFWNSILSVFGFVAIPFERLQVLQASQLALQTSQKKVDEMKKRHEIKRRNTSKQLAKRSTKRVASTALAAATIGTTAVVGTMIFFEVESYCAEKKSLQEDANILDGTDIAFDFEQCITEAEQGANVIWDELRNSSNKKFTEAINVANDFSAATWASVREATAQAMQSTGNVSAGMWDKVQANAREIMPGKRIERE